MLLLKESTFPVSTVYTVLKCDIDLRLLALALAKDIIVISARKQTYVRLFSLLPSQNNKLECGLCRKISVDDLVALHSSSSVCSLVTYSF
jgi:hypothetical protein